MTTFALDLTSQILGWGYFLAWSVSFYPQIWLCFRRRSVVGLHFDFVVYNLLGYIMYAVYTTAVYIDPALGQGSSTGSGKSETVPLNDVVFALHGLLMCTVRQVFFAWWYAGVAWRRCTALCTATGSGIVAIQVLVYDRGDQRVSRMCMLLSTAAVLAVLVPAVMGLMDLLKWKTVLVVCGMVKVGGSFIKYAPQAWLNYKRKSTEGWSIHQINLDFAGGVLSLGQMGIDAWNLQSMIPVIGNGPKMLLGVETLFFDILFILQHYVWYADMWRHGTYGALGTTTTGALAAPINARNPVNSRSSGAISPSTSTHSSTAGSAGTGSVVGSVDRPQARWHTNGLEHRLITADCSERVVTEPVV